MTLVAVPSVFDSFNARALNPSLVARRFVPSSHYDTLAKRRNSIIIGPRGSGKTTLLKMLQQSALESWQHELAASYADRIDYTASFVAADVSWGAQIDALGRGRLNDPEVHRTLGVAAFTTHVLRALINSMIGRIKGREDVFRRVRRVVLSDRHEAQLSRSLAIAWRLRPVIPSLLSLKQALSARLLLIREIADLEVVLGKHGRGERLSARPELMLHFLDAAGLAVDQFDDLVGEPDARWAMCFDELELAPRWIREELLRSLRGANDKFLFKLALSPFSTEFDIMSSPLGGAADADYDPIALWYAEKREGYTFAESLWYGMLQERGIAPIDPRTALGASYFETPRSEYETQGTAYRPGSRLGLMFKQLTQTDKSFREYLTNKGIDPRRLHHVPADQRAAILRKISPLVAVRDFYRAQDRIREGTRARKSRSRKAPSLYVGAEALFAITEGNPRWFIALMDRILDRWPDVTKPISRSVQAEELQRASERFAAMLRTIPTPYDEFAGNQRGLLSLLRAIGEYFHSLVTDKSFVAEPAGTFIVDSHTSPSLSAALGLALNAGAIVYVPDNENQPLLTSLRGKRFRLSYMLAPQYGLPIRLGKPISLHRILSGAKREDVSELPFDESRNG
jgi:hypothetical protein